MANTILRLPIVKARTGLSRSKIYLRLSDGSFPRPVSLGARAVGWLESEVDAWIDRQIEQSRNVKTRQANTYSGTRHDSATAERSIKP
jgi:prophage regulatory protein